MSYMEVQLGNLSQEQLKDRVAVNDFIRSRASRLGVNLADYRVVIDRNHGTVLAVRKDEQPKEIEITYV